MSRASKNWRGSLACFRQPMIDHKRACGVLVLLERQKRFPIWEKVCRSDNSLHLFVWCKGKHYWHWKTYFILFTFLSIVFSSGKSYCKSPWNIYVWKTGDRMNNKHPQFWVDQNDPLAGLETTHSFRWPHAWEVHYPGFVILHLGPDI